MESNIRLGRPDAPRETVERAARRAALAEAELGRPVGEGGSGLSAGQRRRVAVARALLAERPVLLLDEPTAGLDAAAEAQVLAAIRGLAGDGRLVLMVAHRPAVLAAADRVVTLAVLEETVPEETVPEETVPAETVPAEVTAVPAGRRGAYPQAQPGVSA